MMLSNKPDVFVVGCGRSGTSLVTGLLASAGYYIGDHLIEPDSNNPMGFFEDLTVVEINEAILAQSAPSIARLPERYGWDAPRIGQRWLSRLSVDTTIRATDIQLRKIERMCSNKPFCLKDPRFSYTLGIWRQFASNPKFICVFRDPREFVASVFSICMTDQHHLDFAVSVMQLFDVWASMYRFILRNHFDPSNWIFVEYHSLLFGHDITRISDFIGIELDSTQANPSLKRSKRISSFPKPIENLYNHLRLLAGAPGTVDLPQSASPGGQALTVSQ